MGIIVEDQVCNYFDFGGNLKHVKSIIIGGEIYYNKGYTYNDDTVKFNLKYILSSR